jgi:aspartate kinase
MARIVQKYGGTSVKNLSCIRSVANKIREAYLRGDEVIVVVSAQAGVTDRLISDARKLATSPHPRELDTLLCVGEQETVALLSIILNRMGVKAISQLAFQVGIQTCSSHGNARIRSVDGKNVEKLLAEKKVVVVAGFQGISADGDLTTLGRGGSDLTALALAHRFKVDRCEIYTDVDGIFTGDPKVVKNAKLMEQIDFESLLRLSFFDNRVMQDRSVAFAQKNNIPFIVSNTFGKRAGTKVAGTSEKYESCVIGITSRKDLCLLSAEFTSDKVFEILAFFREKGIGVCFVKHRRLGENAFFDEICLAMCDFEKFKDAFFENFQKHYRKIGVVSKLSRIDVVGTNIQANEHASEIFNIVHGKDIVRSEYGKHGLSFMVPSDCYEMLLNQIHDSVFD